MTNWFRICVRAGVVVIPLALVFIAVMNVYYVTGDGQDFGWASYVAWHRDWRLLGPPSNPGTFFRGHIAPIFWLTNVLSVLTPLSKVDFFGVVYGGCYALFAVCVYTLWRSVSPSGFRTEVEALAIALATTFSAIGMQALRLPHIEMLVPALALCFYASLAQTRWRAAMVCFALCLAVREDIGVHLFIFLSLWAMLRSVSRHEPNTRVAAPPQRTLLAFAGIALLYALAAMLVKNLCFEASNNLADNYLGHPVWAHVTWPLMAERLRFFLVERTFLTLPFAVAVLWAVKTRNIYLPLGYLAGVPWLVFLLLSVNKAPGAINFYYPFPFWIALVWPLVALQRSDGAVTKRWPFVLMLAASLVGWHEGRLTIYPLANNEFDTHPFAITREWRRPKAVATFVDYFARHQHMFDRSAFDLPVMTLVIDMNSTVQWIGTWAKNGTTTLPEMIVYFDKAYEWNVWVEPTLKDNPPYRFFYAVPDTKIRVAALGPLETWMPQPMPFVAIPAPQY